MLSPGDSGVNAADLKLKHYRSFTGHFSVGCYRSIRETICAV